MGIQKDKYIQKDEEIIMSKICPNCGQELKDDQSFCTNCGEKFEEKQTIASKAKVNSDYLKSKIDSIDYSAAKESINELTSTAYEGAKDVANKVNKSLKEKQQKEKEKYKKYDGENIEVNDGLTPLWTWLKKDSKKEHFYNETELTLEENQFISAVQEKLDENMVPVQIVKEDVVWDRLDDYQTRYVIHSLDKNVVNPYSCLLSFNKIGKFTFVEENIFITPPHLTKVPGTKVDLPPNNGLSLILYGIVAIVIGMVVGAEISGLLLVCLIVGICLIGYGIMLNSNRASAIEHNKQVDKDIKEWNRIWDEWERKSLMCSFQEDSNGQLSRIFDAVYDTVKQVSAELIKGKVVSSEVEKNDLNDLEQLVSRRRNEYR